MDNLFDKFTLFNIDPKSLRPKDFYKKSVIDNRESYWNERKILIKNDKDTKCFICSNTDNNKIFMEYNEYKLFECSKCSLVFPNIKTDQDYVNLIYDNDFYSQDVEKQIMSTYDYRKNTFGPERLQYIIKNCNFNIKSDNILDFGCGPGYFLKYLQDNNISCRGLELTDFLVDICKSYNLDVSNQSIEFEEKKYNVITMFDVLEHLIDPVNILNTTASKLKPKGYILAYLPNIHSFSFYFQKGKQNLLLPYEHLCFHSDKSLKLLASKTGLEVKSIEYFGLDMVDYLSMKEYEDNISYNDKLKDIIPYLQALIDKSNISNHMRVVFQKI